MTAAVLPALLLLDFDRLKLEAQDRKLDAQTKMTEMRDMKIVWNV